MDYHKPVLLDETLNYLQVKKGGKYIDCTLGDGGHTLEILRKGGVVLGMDVSDQSLERSVKRIAEEGFENEFVPVKGNFKDIENLSKQHGFSQVDGILFDLGYSSSQLDVDQSGLSFLKEQPLDMRLNSELGVSAADLVNALPEKELERVFYDYADERFARRFAQAIVQYRNLKKFQTTKDLSDLLVSVAPPGYEHGRIHPATRVFQALRIAVNGEFENLKLSLPRAAHLLLPGGRMLVISFHSLEDKMVKNFGRDARLMIKTVTDKPVEASEQETSANIRARSAKLRVFERI